MSEDIPLYRERTRRASRRVVGGAEAVDDLFPSDHAQHHHFYPSDASADTRNYNELLRGSDEGEGGGRCSVTALTPVCVADPQGLGSQEARAAYAYFMDHEEDEGASLEEAVPSHSRNLHHEHPLMSHSHHNFHHRTRSEEDAAEEKALRRRLLAESRNSRKQQDLYELDIILRESEGVEMDAETEERVKDEKIRARRAQAARQRYQRMSEEERRDYNHRRRMRALGYDENGRRRVNSSRIQDHLKVANMRKAEQARIRYHAMTEEEKRAYNLRRTEAFRRRRREEEDLLSTPAGRISHDALQRAQLIMVRNARKAQAARARYQRMSKEERREYNQKRAASKKQRELETGIKRKRKSRSGQTTGSSMNGEEDERRGGDEGDEAVDVEGHSNHSMDPSVNPARMGECDGSSLHSIHKIEQHDDHKDVGGLEMMPGPSSLHERHGGQGLLRHQPALKESLYLQNGVSLEEMIVDDRQIDMHDLDSEHIEVVDDLHAMERVHEAAAVSQVYYQEEYDGNELLEEEVRSPSGHGDGDRPPHVTVIGFSSGGEDILATATAVTGISMHSTTPIERIEEQKARRAERARIRYRNMPEEEKARFNSRRAEQLRKMRERDEQLVQLATTEDQLDEETQRAVVEAQRRRSRRAEQARIKYRRMSSEERRTYNAMRDAQRRQRKREMEAVAVSSTQSDGGLSRSSRRRVTPLPDEHPSVPSTSNAPIYNFDIYAEGVSRWEEH